MKTLQLPESSADVREFLDLAADEPILVQVSGGRTFAVQEIDEGDLEAYTLSQSTRLFEILDAARAEAQKTGWLTTEELKASLGIE